jgi:hypothetical protein
LPSAGIAGEASPWTAPDGRERNGRNFRRAQCGRRHAPLAHGFCLTLRWREQDSNRRFRGGSARRFVCPLSSLLASAPPAKAKGADPSRASRGATYRATSSRHGGRHHPGTPSEIKSECRARSSRIRKRLPPESAGMPFWRSMFRRKRRKAVARNFQAARHDATKLTKALPERAPPTSKGCRRLAASSRLAEQCSAVSSCDSALPAHYSSGLASGRGHDKHRTRRLATILIHARLPSTPSESWQTKSPTRRASARQ